MGDSTEQSANSSTFQIHSPDLFADDEYEFCNDNQSEASEHCEASKDINASHVSHQQQGIVKLETARLQRLLELLQGVPPPPSKTIPQIKVTDVLSLWRDQKEEPDGSICKSKNNKGCCLPSLWKPTVSLCDVLNSKWPAINNEVFHDVHYNTCAASEDVERLSMKLHERYVGAETSSWCTTVVPSLSNSAKKRQRTRGLGHTSPGCRLSHLARRRQTFSSANLAQLSSVAGSGAAGGALRGPSAARRLLVSASGGATERRRIMVEIKKTDKNKRLKTNSKDAQSKAGPSSSSGGAVKTIVPDKLPAQSTKRALFQSPEEQKQALALVGSTNVEQNPAQRMKRALWPADSSAAVKDNGKRSLDVDSSHSLPQPKVQCMDEHSRYVRTSRSLPFSLGQSYNNNFSSTQNDGNKTSRRASDQGPSCHTNTISILSELHKRKLYWAICQALRKEGISSKNSDFRPCATILAHHYIRIRQALTEIPASTSEHMLQIVSAKVGEVVQAHQSFRKGQEENQCNDKQPKKEERSNKELFRDATASLNVRRSLSVSLSSSDPSSSDIKSQPTRRVPSARKSLTFDCIDPKGDGIHESIENNDSRFSLSEKGSDGKKRPVGETASLPNVKRVSRSLFLSPTDNSKIVNGINPKDLLQEDLKHNLTSAVDLSDPRSEEFTPKDEHSSEFNNSKITNTGVVIHQGSDTSSVPSARTGNEADNEISKAGETSIKVEQVIPDFSSHSNEISNTDAVAHLGSDTSSAPSARTVLSTGNEADNEISKASEISIKVEHVIPNFNSHLNQVSSSEFPDDTNFDIGVQYPYAREGFQVQTRILRDTKQRAARAFQIQPLRRVTRKSLSLSSRSVRSSSTESGELIGNIDPTQCKKEATSPDMQEVETFNLVTSIEVFNDQSFLKVEPLVATEASIPIKTEERSPMSLEDTVVTETSDSNSAKMQPCLNGVGSVSSDTSAACDPNSEISENNKDPDTALEAKVITPLLEGAAHESSVCVDSDPSSNIDNNLTFRGRIESLKPLAFDDTSVKVEPGLSFNVCANILGVGDVHEKSPVLEKWAERASRSSQKCLDENTNACNSITTIPTRRQNETLDESMLPWEESQLDAASQCATKLYEDFKSIFDSSSQPGSS